MTLKKRIRCGSCKAVLQVTVRADADVTIVCPRCDSSLRIPASKQTDSPTRPLPRQSPRLNKRDEVPEDFDSSDETWDTELPFDDAYPQAGEEEEFNNSLLPRSGSRKPNPRSVAQAPPKAPTAWETFKQLPAFIRIGTVSGGIAGLILLLLLAVKYLVPVSVNEEDVADSFGVPVSIPVETANNGITTAQRNPGAEIPSQTVKSDSIVDLKARSVCLRQSYDFVLFNETRDELAAVKYDQNEVHIYSTESLQNAEAEPVIYAVPGQSRFVVFKPLGTDGFYCAAGEGHTIAVFSADGKGAMRSVQLKPGTIYGLAASESPEDPWVFVARGPSHDVEVSAFHVTTGEAVENVGKLGSGQFCVSPSGQQVTDGWTVMTRSDLQQPPVNLPSQVFPSVNRIPGGQSTLFFAHSDQFLVRNDISTVNATTFLDLESHAPCKLEGSNLAPLPASTSCAFRKIPLMVGKWTPDRRNVPTVDHPGQVVLDTFLTNTLERIPTNYRIDFDTKWLADFAPSWPEKVYGNGPRPPKTEAKAMSYADKLQLLPDNRNSQLLCVLGRQVLFVPASEFQHGTEVAAKLPTVSMGPHPPGLAVRIPLATDPSVKVSLGLPLPEGSSIDDETFVWTPTDEQLGTHQLRFIYESGSTKRPLLAPVTVAHRWTSLKSAYQEFLYGNGTGGLYGWSIDGLSLERYQPVRNDFASSAPMTGQFRTSAIILDFVEKTFDDKSYVCVLTQQPPAVHILDAQSLELIREIPIVSSSPLALFASQNPEDPFLYYTAL